MREHKMLVCLHFGIFGQNITLMMEDGLDCQGMNTLEDFLNLLKCIPFTKQVV